MILGRDGELAAVERALADARLGRSATLVIRGEAGIGKTALLRFATERAGHMRVLAARGVEFETDVPFSGLDELLRPTLSVLKRLPATHATAIRSALGLGERVETDRLLVGAGTLGLISGYAERAPVLVVVDDAQWMDRASTQALAFAARRLLADPVAVLITVREGEGSPLVDAGLPELPLSALDREAAAALLQRTATDPVDPHVASAILETAGGNPLALVELAAEASRLAPAAGVSMLPVTTTVERAYLRRTVGLSGGAQRALLLMAAAGTADLATIRRAGDVLGLQAPDVHAAEACQGLILERGGRLEFVHPLARAAIYHASSPADRRAAHRALARVTAGPDDADRQAWHMAAAAVGPDTAAADALNAAGDRAQGRSAHASAAAAFEASARLTEPAQAQAMRLLAAAENAWLAGGGRQALDLIESARRLAPSRSRLELDIDNLAGHIALRQGAVTDGFRMQLATAEAVQASDRLKAVRILADATLASYVAGYPAEILPAAEHALALLRPGDPPGVAACAHVAYGGLAVLAGRGSEGPRHLHASVELFRSIPVGSWDALLFICAGIAGLFLREAEAGRDLLSTALSGAREFAPAVALPPVLHMIGRDAATTERWAEARGYYEEGARLARDTTQLIWLAGLLSGLAWLDALEGRADECRSHAAEGRSLSERFGMSFFTAWSLTALAELELGLGRPEAAIGHLLSCQAVLDKVRILDPDLAPAPLLVEAYVRAARVDDARAAAREYQELAQAKGQPFSLARAARVRGLLAGDEAYAAEFESALRHHAGTVDTFERARTQLCYGERLRRARKRVQARHQLRAALAAFDRLGARPWATQALAELTATGETARVRDDGTRHSLTPQELQVALALAEGRTTREAAAKLYLSPKTVEYHLRSVYDKLEIRSREELATVLQLGR